MYYKQHGKEIVPKYFDWRVPDVQKWWIEQSFLFPNVSSSQSPGLIFSQIVHDECDAEMQSLRIVFVKLKPVSRLMTEVQMKPLTWSGGSSSRGIPQFANFVSRDSIALKNAYVCYPSKFA